MTVDEAKHKMDFLKKAYQKLIDEKVDSGKLIGDGVMGEWKAETPIDEAYKDMIEALDLAIKALEQTEQTRWIPVSEKLPEELVPVNITWINHSPESYYAGIKDYPFTATGVYFNGQWYWWSTFCTDTLAEYSHNYNDVIDDDIEITAWMPLPEPHKAEREVEE
jgi:hypothetical protein